MIIYIARYSKTIYNYGKRIFMIV